MMKANYTYKAKVVKVYDGDTITVDIDLGLDVWIHDQKIRLYGIDTPEVRGAEKVKGLLVRDHLRKMIMGKEIILETFKDKKGKYGRWLGTVWFQGVNINEHLVKQRMARVDYYK